MQRLPLVLLLIVLLWGTNATAQISERRQFQLDSISTNIPKTNRQNFDSVHCYLHRNGLNDEERVWLFYGYIGTHFKYDKKRKRDNKDAPIYSPEYTAQRRSGVCRDFSAVFKALCDKSGIPCLEVTGRANTGFLPAFAEKTTYVVTLHPRRMTGLHAWNVVKINGTWQLMDPTWTAIEKTVKIPVYNERTKTTKIVLVKSVKRTYFNPESSFMMKTHAPFHPAFLLSENVPSFRTTFRKPVRQKVFQAAYPYAKTIDSMCTHHYPYFTRPYYEGCMSYSHHNDLAYYYYMALALPFQKSGKFNQPTIADYDRALIEAKALTDTITKTLGISYLSRYAEFEDALLKKKARLIKQVERRKL